MALSQVKIPIMVVSGIICLGLGAAGGAGAMTFFGYHWRIPAIPAGQGFNMPGGSGAPGGGMPKGMMAKMMGKGKGGGSKKQLENLVAKLDLLTQAPLKLDFTPEQKAKLAKHLNGMAKETNLSEDNVKKHLDGLLEILSLHKSTLEGAGFRWPGAAASPQIDFDDHVKAIQGRLKITGAK